MTPVDVPVDATIVAIHDIMTSGVVTTAPDATIDEVAGALRVRHIGGMPVVDDRGVLVGMVSEFDIVTKRGRTARDIMSHGVVSVGEDATAEQVTNLMALHGIRRVPVVREGRLIGIVTRSDLLRLFANIRWLCQTCGDYERGFVKPERCVRCNGDAFTLEREQRVAEG